MTAQYIILGLLNTNPNYGYELKRLYDMLFGEHKPIHSAQIYSTLSRLERNGAVQQAKGKEPSGGPERIKYTITSSGKAAFEAWLSTPEEPASTLQITLYIKTVMALLREGEAATYLDRQRHTHLERMRTLTHERRTANLAAKLLLDHAILHIEADLRWIDLTSSRLTQLKEELCHQYNPS